MKSIISLKWKLCSSISSKDFFNYFFFATRGMLQLNVSISPKWPLWTENHLWEKFWSAVMREASVLWRTVWKGGWFGIAKTEAWKPGLLRSHFWFPKHGFSLLYFLPREKSQIDCLVVQTLWLNYWGDLKLFARINAAKIIQFYSALETSRKLMCSCLKSVKTYTSYLKNYQ